MKSKHSLWQARWDIDQFAALAVHDSGLRVRLAAAADDGAAVPRGAAQDEHGEDDSDDGPAGVADNAAEIELALTPVHGAHNAAAMVLRLVREGRQLLIDPHSRGWRGGQQRTA